MKKIILIFGGVLISVSLSTMVYFNNKKMIRGATSTNIPKPMVVVQEFGENSSEVKTNDKKTTNQISSIDDSKRVIESKSEKKSKNEDDLDSSIIQETNQESIKDKNQNESEKKDENEKEKSFVEQPNEQEVKEQTVKKNSTGIWDSLGMTKEQYYNEPMYSWERIDFDATSCGSEENCLNECAIKGDTYLNYLYSCDIVTSASGKFLGVMLDLEKLN